MSFNLAVALICSLVIIALAIVWVIRYNSRCTRTKSKPKKTTNSNLRLYRTMVYCTSFGLILSSVLADIVAIKMFYANGEWNIGLFFAQIFSVTFLCFIFGLMFSPIYFRIKHNLLVRNRDHSAASVFRTIGKILLCAGPMAAAFILVFSGVSEGMAKFILFVGCMITAGITGAIAKNRNKKIEKSLREGLKNHSNVEEVWGNSITDNDILDCVACDYLNRKKNLVIKHDLADINFSAVDYVTRVGKNSDTEDPAEVISYKITKVAKSPIICTFDKELTDAPMQLIETENPAFNKQFFTYCDNAQDAFYILTPQVMERMIDAAKIYKRLIFNFDGDELFIIIYQDKFLDSLANEDPQTAFADLKKMLDDLVFKDIAKLGAHVQRKKNAPKDEDQVTSEKPIKKAKTKTWKIVVIVIAVIIVLGFLIPGIAMCSSGNVSSPSKSNGSFNKEIKPEDYAPIQTYLTQKYGVSFTYDEKEYNNIWDSDLTHTVYAHFIDANGIKFEGHSDIWKKDSDEVKFTDSYQSVLYSNQLANQIKALNPYIDDVRISPGYYTEKFSSIDQYIAKGDTQFISVFMKNEFGDLNEDTSLELAKLIINNTKISNAFLNFYMHENYSLKATYRYKNGEYNLS